MDGGSGQRLITDHTLGKLARWLRALGCDVACHRGRADRSLLRRALLEDRIVVTRSRNLAERPFRGGLVLVTAEGWEEQLGEVARALNLSPDDGSVLGRCLECNEVLTAADCSDVKGRVPDYILETQEAFRICMSCGRVFWSGSHAARMLRVMRRRIPPRPP